MTQRPARHLLVILTLALAVTACGGDDTAEGAATDETPAHEAPDGIDLGRVVVLGEDFLLADVLSLSVRPVAATTTLGDTFSGIDADTAGIEPLDQLSLNPEQLAALRPDLLITTSFYAEQSGAELFEGIAETVIVPFDSDWRTQLTTLAAELGADARAAELLSTYDDAVAAAGEAIDDDLVVSMGTVYSGDNLAVWVDGPVNIPSTFLDAGVTLRPAAGELDGESNGRAYISFELLDEFDGDVIVLLQTSVVEGEDASLDAVRASDLWATLPAVQADRVEIVDRLGYAGIEGRIRLAGELPELLS